MTPTSPAKPSPQPPRHEDLDAVWKALANPVRREILDLLREKPHATGELVLEFPDLSRFAVMQHLEVLVEANLVNPRKKGRVRFNHLNAVPIQQIHERWVTRFEAHWATSLIALKNRLEGAPPISPAPRTSDPDSRTARLGLDQPGELPNASNR